MNVRQAGEFRHNTTSMIETDVCPRGLVPFRSVSTKLLYKMGIKTSKTYSIIKLGKHLHSIRKLFFSRKT